MKLHDFVQLLLGMVAGLIIAASVLILRLAFGPKWRNWRKGS